jgi:DNA-binding winged helix-turn-helix (wHTH) protein/tetratricopeptide (TPR) repeat protein
MPHALPYPWPSDTCRLRLGNVEFDLRYRSVSRNGRIHELNQRCFDLLLLFLREPHTLHTRDEIFRRVWAGAVVEDANITTSIWLLRKALGDDAKGWIRTVAKHGYIFDPPCRLEPAPANDPIGPEPAQPAIEPMPQEDVRELRLAPRSRPVWRYGILGAALILGVAVSLAMTYLLRGASQRTRVMVLAVPDLSVSSEARWPSELLRDWIEWQLEARSDRVVLMDAASARDDADQVLLLSAVAPVARADDASLHADLREGGRNRSFDRSGPPENMLAAIDDISRDIVTDLLPDVSTAELPSLQTLDRTSALDFVNAVAAEKRGRWNEAARHYRNVLDQSPDFVYARLHLATALAELGQSNAAQAELPPVERWVSTLPASMRPLLRARMRAIRQEFSTAADEFGELYVRSAGSRADLRLAQATNLLRAGRGRDALVLLSDSMPDSPALALAWLVKRSECEFETMDLARSRATAGEAIRLAQTLGWDQERARANLLLVDGLAWSSLPIDDTLYDDAVAGFDAAGDRLGVLRAKFLRDVRDAETGSKLPVFDELLAEARAAGNTAAEFDAIRRFGLLQLHRGETQPARERLRQAEAVAESAGDRLLQRQVSVNLLRLDMWRGDLGTADRRLGALRAEPRQGMLAFLIGLAQTRVQYRRGQYEEALATIAETQAILRVQGTEGGTSAATGLDCAQGSTLVRLGRIADAKTVTDICGSPTLPYYAQHATIAKVELAMFAGDETSARETLLSVADSGVEHPSQIDRWMLIAELAPLLARAGEPGRAQQLIDEAMPAVSRSGFVAIELELRIGGAEIAFAQGRVADARTEAARIRALAASDDWAVQSRLLVLDTLLLRLDGKSVDAFTVLATLHERAREHGDVLGELLAHSIADAELDRLCPEDRQVRLLAQSGMRGADLAWMVAPHRAALSLAPQGSSSPPDAGR